MSNHRIAEITLQQDARARRTPEVEFEYNTAVNDLVDTSDFRYGETEGPYALLMKIQDNRLALVISVNDERLGELNLPITPFKRIVKDYFIVCESYYKAVRAATTTAQVETIDMARRGLHNEGAEILQDILKPSIETDFDTARRLFTLLCVLHMR